MSMDVMSVHSVDFSGHLVLTLTRCKQYRDFVTIVNYLCKPLHGALVRMKV